MAGEKRDEKGRFVEGASGNPSGQTKIDITERFLRDLTEVWKEHGKFALEKVARGKPDRFVSICAQLVPKEKQVGPSQGLIELLKVVNERREVIDVTPGVAKRSRKVRGGGAKGKALSVAKGGAKGATGKTKGLH